jgi:hypothetical protein
MDYGHRLHDKVLAVPWGDIPGIIDEFIGLVSTITTARSCAPRAKVARLLPRIPRMRILRIRRGFTTNSSGANEYLPDGGSKYDGSTPRTDGGTLPNPTVSVGPRSSAPQAVLSTIEPWGSTAPASEPASNSTTVGVVFLVVVGAFVAGPVVRMILRRRRKNPAPPDHHAK